MVALDEIFKSDWFFTVSVSILYVLVIIWFLVGGPGPISDKIYEKRRAQRYRKSLYLTDKKQLTIKQKTAILIEILVMGGLLVVAQSTDFLNVISVVCTITGFSCFQFYDYIMNNAKTCSINFKYQMEHHKVCQFKYVPGWDRGMIMRDTLMASLPLTIVFTALSIIPYFYSVSWEVFCILLIFYLVCDAKSIFYLRLEKSDIKIAVCYVLQMFFFFIFFCMTWVLSAKMENNLELIAVYRKVGCFLVIYAGLCYLGLLMYLECFWHKEVPYVFYPGTYKEEGNYFEIEMEDGKVFNSKERFFYPISSKDDIRLLFENGTSLMLNGSDVKKVAVYGCGRKECCDVLQDVVD